MRLLPGKRIVRTLAARSLALCFVVSPAAGIAQGVKAETTWYVGPTRTLKRPSEATRFAKDGDIISITAGRYHNDYASWHQNDLTILGIGGMAHLSSNQLIPNGKGIWIVNGSRVRIENIEFSGAKVADTNGAGIRHQGGDLSLHNTYFHHNEFSVLSGKSPTADITISDSRFWFQKRESRFSHGIYIGEAKRFSITGSHITGTDLGHQIKSRAWKNHIAYNRIEDTINGNSSRLIDLPNCGESVIIGNDLYQSVYTKEDQIIAYGAEGCEGREPQYQSLLVAHNTVINDARGTALVWNFVNEPAQISNNLILGKTRVLRGRGKTAMNVQLPKREIIGNRWRAPADRAILDTANSVEFNGEVVIPTHFFRSPIGMTERKAINTLDIGAHEWVEP